MPALGPLLFIVPKFEVKNDPAPTDWLAIELVPPIPMKLELELMPKLFEFNSDGVPPKEAVCWFPKKDAKLEFEP